jgi:hypothetical protein
MVLSNMLVFALEAIFDNPPGGPSRTVNKQVCIDWIALNIFTLLGNFEKGGPHSSVILDNASIHMEEEIVSLIRSKGAYILYTAAFSPDINNDVHLT